LLKQKDQSKKLVFVFAFKDEHQGEGGTLVFVDANNTITVFAWQEGKR
jgi:hypothetical protein